MTLKTTKTARVINVANCVTVDLHEYTIFPTGPSTGGGISHRLRLGVNTLGLCQPSDGGDFRTGSGTHPTHLPRAVASPSCNERWRYLGTDSSVFVTGTAGERNTSVNEGFQMERCTVPLAPYFSHSRTLGHFDEAAIYNDAGGADERQATSTMAAQHWPSHSTGSSGSRAVEAMRQAPESFSGIDGFDLERSNQYTHVEGLQHLWHLPAHASSTPSQCAGGVHNIAQGRMEAAGAALGGQGEEYWEGAITNLLLLS